MTNNFWDSFWPGFLGSLLSSIIVAVIVAALMPWLINSWIEKASLQVFAIVNYYPSGKARYKLSIYNSGRYNFNSDEIYFHVYIHGNSGFVLDSAQLSTNVDEEMIAGVKWYHISGLIKHPCFQCQTTWFLVFVADSELAKSEMRYFLSTSRGMFPSSNKQLMTGHFILDRMGRVEILAERH